MSEKDCEEYRETYTDFMEVLQEFFIEFMGPVSGSAV